LLVSLLDGDDDEPLLPLVPELPVEPDVLPAPEPLEPLPDMPLPDVLLPVVPPIEPELDEPGVELDEVVSDELGDVDDELELGDVDDEPELGEVELEPLPVEPEPVELEVEPEPLPPELPRSQPVTIAEAKASAATTGMSFFMNSPIRTVVDVDGNPGTREASAGLLA
jgi:hypothetical protein